MGLHDFPLKASGSPTSAAPERRCMAVAISLGAAGAVAAAVAGYGGAILTLVTESGTMPAQEIQEMGHMMAGDASANAAGRPVKAFKPLTCQKLPNVTGKSMTVALVEFPPNAYTPRHRHPGSVMAFVVKGTLRSQLEGEQPVTYSIGQTWFEPPGAIHLFAENVSKTEPATILATFIADDDCGALAIRG